MKHSTLAMALATSLTALAACGEWPEATPTEPEPVAWMLERSDLYLEDRAFRRDALEQALWRPELPYAKKLLDNYGLERGGWDLLPVLDFEVDTVQGPDDRFEGEALMQARPTTRDEWLALGERAFWSMPMRRDPYLAWLADHPEHWEAVGVERTPEGDARGFVRYIDPRGREQVGISCGLCHGAAGEPGRADRGVDLGLARALYLEPRGLDGSDFASWGPGKLDVTNDGVNDPVAIPNLWGASEQSHFNASGVVRVETPASAAVRFETQYIINHSYEARPDRALPWALAMFVMSLEAPASADAGADVSAGAEVFEASCAGCHDPVRGYSGDLVAAEALTSDPRIAASITRGTGSYRVPSLLGVSQGGPYLHDLSAPTLEVLLERGHPTGDLLDAERRRDLIDFLNTL